jgi:DNA-binding beta-propeller fold protein YncE
MRPETLAKIILVILLLVLAGLVYYYAVVLPRMGGGIVDEADTGTTVGGIEFLYAIYGSGVGNSPYFSKPMGVGTDKFENIYVTDADQHRVYVFAKGGRFLYTFGGFGVAWPEVGYKATWEPGKFNKPYGIDVDKNNGDIYVADMMNQQIQKFDRSGRFIKAFPKPWEVVGRGGGGKGQGLLPTALALQGDNVFVADAYQIAVFTKDGKFVRQFGRPGRQEDGLDRPNGIAVDKDGSVYVGDSNHVRIQCFRPSGKGKKLTYKLAWVTGKVPENALSVDTAGNRQFGLPRGIDVDGQGNVFVVDTFHFSIQVYDRNGKKLGEVGDRGSSGGQFNFPNDIAITSSGIGYITDRANQRVQAVRIPTMLKGKQALSDTSFPWWPLLLLLPLLAAAYFMNRKPLYVAHSDFLSEVVANGDVAQFVEAVKRIMVTPDTYNEYFDYVQDDKKMETILKIAKQDPDAVQGYSESWQITGSEAELLICGRRTLMQRILMIRPVFMLEKIDLRNKLEDAGYATINHAELMEQLNEAKQETGLQKR